MQHLTYRSDKPLLDVRTADAAGRGMNEIRDLLEAMALIDLVTLMLDQGVQTLSLPVVDYLDQHGNTEHAYDHYDIRAYHDGYCEVDSEELDTFAELTISVGLDPVTRPHGLVKDLFQISAGASPKAGGRDEYRLPDEAGLTRSRLETAIGGLTEHPAATLLAEVIRLGASRRS